MNSLKTIIAVGLFYFFVFQAYGFDFDISTICKHPTKDLVYIAGEFNTILIVDVKTGKSINQIDLDYTVEAMEFSANQTELIVFDGSQVRFINAESGEQSRAFGADKVRFFENAPYFIDFSWPDPFVKVYSTMDGALMGVLKPDFKPMEAGFSPDKKELIILSEYQDLENEASLITEKVEELEDFSFFNREFVKQQNDGKGSVFAVYDVPSFEEKMKVEIPYYGSSHLDLNLSKFENNYYLVCFTMLIRIDQEGKSYPIQPDEAGFTHATSSSPDGTYLILAESEAGTLYRCDKQEGQRFDVSVEFMAPTSKDLTCAADKAYLISEDYTVIVMNYLGQSVKRFRISEPLGGYEVFYSASFSDEEELKSDQTILDEVLLSLSKPKVSLENPESLDYLKIGTFKTIEAAESFMEKLDEKDFNAALKIAPSKKG